jgi:hypothetical protein
LAKSIPEQKEHIDTLKKTQKDTLKLQELIIVLVVLLVLIHKEHIFEKYSLFLVVFIHKEHIET